MDTLVDVVKTEVEKYATEGFNLRLLAVSDDVRHNYTVIAVDYPKQRNMAGVVVMARIVGGMVIVEEDATDKPLLDALIQAGIPCEKIILAYAGEPIPEP